MYRNKKIYEIKYTDVDAYDNIKLSSLLSFAEESSCLSADELGFGYKDVHHLNIGFVIANWYFEFSQPVKIGHNLETHLAVAPQIFYIFQGLRAFYRR